MASSQSAAIQALQSAQAIGLPLTTAPVDSVAVGFFWIRVNVTVNTTDTTIAIQLPRRATGFILWSTTTGAYPFPGTGGIAAWTDKQIILKAATATVCTLFIG